MLKNQEKCKYESCEYTASDKYSLSRHITEVHEGKKPFKCDTCDYSCYRKSLLTRYSMTTKINSCVKIINTPPLYYRNIWKNMWRQLMKERNYLIVIFANIAVIKKVKLENTLLPFMKEKSYSNVTNVITSVIIRDEQACWSYTQGK